MKEKSTIYNGNISKIIINKQIVEQRTISMDWWYRDKLIYKISKVLSFILVCFTVVINFLIINGNILKISDYNKSTNTINAAASLANATYSFIAGTLFLIMGYIFFKLASKQNGTLEKPKKNATVSLVLQSVGALILAATSISSLITNKLSNMYATAVDGGSLSRINFELYGYHIVPLTLIIISAVLMFVMLRLDFKDKTTLYKALTDRLYKQFVNDNPTYTQNDWEKYLNNYNPADEK